MKLNLALIKKKRKEKGLFIDDMAVKLGLTNGSMYWKRENGAYNFKPEEVMKVSEILEIPINDLFLSNGYSKMEISNKNAI